MKKLLFSIALINLTAYIDASEGQSWLSYIYSGITNLGSHSIDYGAESIGRVSGSIAGIFKDSNSVDFDRDGREARVQTINVPSISSAPSTSAGPEQNKKQRILDRVDQQIGTDNKLVALGQELETPHRLLIYNRYDGTTDWIAYTGQNINPTECDTYKIHLMPKQYSLGFIYDVVDALLHNPILKEAVHTSKFSARHLGMTIEHRDQLTDDAGEVAPIVVLYAFGKENAQKALNEIYRSFAHTEGNGVRPRFNGKVTDLIWIAQGNSNYKFLPGTIGYIQPPYEVQYEEPHRIYCAPDFPEPGSSHHLMHPETGEPLVSTGETESRSSTSGPTSSSS